ncbi:MAG: hypothetical protein IT294_05870 [Deltaproteobacteria bacterium]|nr:hypothetical protein [Deltaproteobacteria bacterium]
MHISRLLSVMVLVLGVAARASAQPVSCAAASNLCTGDPCTTTAIEVEPNCMVDFGNVTLVIGGQLEVPSGGTLAFTASSIIVEGRIEASGASVTLTADMGAADLRTEVDVGAGSFTVNATGNIDVKQRVKAKTGGSITLAADGTLETKIAAVIEAGGTIDLSGDTGVTLGGKVFAGEAGSSNVQITSSAGLVTLNQDVRASSTVPSTITVDGATGVVVNKNVYASGIGGPGGAIALASSGGDVALHGKLRVKGDDAGSVTITAPNGEVKPIGIDAKGQLNGGTVTITADTIELLKSIDAEGKAGVGGTVTLTATTAVTVGADIEAQGETNGGAITLAGDLASGSVVVIKSLKLGAKSGNGGTLTVSAPAGAVSLGKGKVDASSKGGTGGSVFVDGSAITVGPKARIEADGTLGGEVRFDQSGAGTFSLNASIDARDDGIIEALAPAGTLTVTGRLLAGPAGCVGLAAGTLNAGGAMPDVPVTPSCP